MRKASLRLLVLASAVTAGGCGDNWPKLAQAELTLVHEFNDALMKIVDDDSAKFYKEFYFEKIKKTWEDLQKRKEVYIKVHVSNKQILDEFVKDLAKTIKALGLNFNANGIRRAKDTVIAQWQRDEQKKNQLGKLSKELDQLAQEFIVIYTPRYKSEVESALRRREQQFQRIRVVIRQLSMEGAETTNLSKISEAGSMLSNFGAQQP